MVKLFKQVVSNLR